MGRAEATPRTRAIGSASSGTMIAAAMVLANAANYGFQILTSRFLSVDEYGLLGSFMSAIAVITVSTGALQTTAARAVAQAENRPDLGLAQDRLLRTAVVAGAIAGAVILLAGPLEMKLFDVGMLPIVALALFVAPAAVDSIAAGRLQGARRFRGLGVYSASQAVTKLAVATGVLLLGVGVGGVLLAVVCGAAVVATLGLLASRDLGALQVHALGRDGRLGFAAFTLLWVALSADVVIARSSFEPNAAGIYVAAAVLGKAVLWLPMIVNQLLFPRLTATDGEAGGVLQKAVVAVVAVAATAVGFLALLGGIAFRVLYGDRYASADEAAWKIGLAMIPMAIVNLLLYDFLARSDARFVAPLAALVVGECVALTLVSPTPGAYAAVLGASAALGSAVLLVLRFRAAPANRSDVDDREVVVP